MDPEIIAAVADQVIPQSEEGISLLQLIASVISGGLAGFAVVAFKIGRYVEKVDQLEKIDVQRRLSTLEGKWSKDSITQTESPVSLNEKGVELLEKSGAKKFVDEYSDQLVSKIEELGNKTAYDIQENAKRAVKHYDSEDSFAPLKDFAFQEGIDLEIVELAASLYLRDIALEKFKFSLEDVDSSAPSSETP